MFGILLLGVITFGPLPLIAAFARAIGGPERWPLFIALAGLWLGIIALFVTGISVSFGPSQ